MINNRQAGRRRGRGGQRPPNNPGRPEQGNRIDNRARGNASQLHEKYKTLARDAQTQGDRVNSEYYLQFADHYFRVLSESRSRFEDNNPQQQRRQHNDAASDYDDDGDDNRDDRNDRNDARDQRGDDRPQQQQRGRDDRDDDSKRPNGRDAAQQEEPRQPRRARQPRPRPEEAEPAAIEADRLPPALSQDSERSNGSGDEEPAPRRRARRPRAQEGEGATQS